MDNTINVGVIGFGQMGRFHADIYRKLSGVKLKAVCDARQENLADAKKLFGCDVYENYVDLLNDPTIDAVSIVLPDNMHRDAVEVAVSNGKHILLEKPLAKDLADSRALYELTKNYDKVFTVGFLLRFDPRFALIKQSLDEGELGDIIHVYCRRNSPIIGPRRYIGASDLAAHVMIHDIDYVNWFMEANPVSVVAKARSVLLKEHGMNDVIYALIEYDNGALACLEACWVLPESSPTIIDDKVELVGTRGVAYVDACDNGVRFVTDSRVQYPDSRHWYGVNGATSGDLSEEITAFIGNITQGTKSIITPKQAFVSSLVVDAIERSIAANAQVSIDLDGVE